MQEAAKELWLAWIAGRGMTMREFIDEMLDGMKRYAELDGGVADEPKYVYGQMKSIQDALTLVCNEQLTADDRRQMASYMGEAKKRYLKSEAKRLTEDELIQLAVEL